MKTLNQKRPKTRLLLLGSLVLIFGFMVAFTALSPAPEGKFQKENQAVRNDITGMMQSHETVRVQKQLLKEFKKADDKQAAIAAKKEICKANADLKRDKAYLKSDKKALVQLHKNEMKETCTSLKNDKHNLSSAKKQLKGDLRNGSTVCLVDDARLVANQQKQVNHGETALNKQQKSYDKEIAAINNDLDKANGRGAYASNNSPREKFLDLFGAGKVEDKPVALQ